MRRWFCQVLSAIILIQLFGISSYSYADAEVVPQAFTQLKTSDKFPHYRINKSIIQDESSKTILFSIPGVPNLKASRLNISSDRLLPNGTSKVYAFSIGDGGQAVIAITKAGSVGGHILYKGIEYQIRFVKAEPSSDEILIEKLPEPLGEKDYVGEKQEEPVPLIPDSLRNIASLDGEGGNHPMSSPQPVKVLVVYTPELGSNFSSIDAIKAHFDSYIASTNLALSGSFVDNIVLSLADARELVGYQQPVDPTIEQYYGILDAIEANGDGVLDEVHTWRDEVAADLVIAMVRLQPNIPTCGVSSVLSEVSPAWEENAFSMATDACGAMTFSHELGHAMGCGHDRANGSAGTYSYSYGYKTPNGYRDVMAYPPGTRVNYYSNPDVIYSGYPLGIHAGQPNEADNALTMRNNAPYIQLFRTESGLAPHITLSPVSASAFVGDTVTFTTDATGGAPLHFYWKRYNTYVPNVDSKTYTFTATLADNLAQYRAVVCNADGCRTSPRGVYLTVYGPPVINSQPSSETVLETNPINLQVGAVGQSLSYQWIRNGVVIPGETSRVYQATATRNDNGAHYKVIVSNPSGSVTSNDAIVTVNPIPHILQQPQDQYVQAGQSATFSVVADGGPNLRYQWMKNGFNINGGTAATYTVTSTTQSNNGEQYVVRVMNDYYSVDSDPGVLHVGVASPTPTNNGAPTQTPTATATSTPTSTKTSTITPSPTATNTRTPTFTPINTNTVTTTPTRTSTYTATATSTSIPPTSTPTRTATPTQNSTQTPSATPTRTSTSTPTRTATYTVTASITPTIAPTATKTATPTQTIAPTLTPTSTFTPTSTRTSVPTSTPTWTSSPTSTNTPTRTATITASNTPTVAATMTATATKTVTPSPTATRTQTPSQTPTKTVTASPSSTATVTPTATATQSSTITPTATPSAVATSTPSPTPTVVVDPLTQCSNLIDDDGDGLIDTADPGCSSSGDDSERSLEGPACDNGVDDDGDGFSDFPSDPGCASATDIDERNAAGPMCDNGIDDDGDGRIDMSDPGCTDVTDSSELGSPDVECEKIDITYQKELLRHDDELFRGVAKKMFRRLNIRDRNFVKRVSTLTARNTILLDRISSLILNCPNVLSCSQVETSEETNRIRKNLGKMYEITRGMLVEVDASSRVKFARTLLKIRKQAYGTVKQVPKQRSVCS